MIAITSSKTVKSQMKYFVRAWNKELKQPEWVMGDRKKRKDCAREFAAISVAACVEWGITVDCQYAADDAVAEEVSDWNA
ncbi:hypothetical protein NZQ04_001300 [Salmonella enterica]|nr:hypothetical protein [Salmonella enterica]